MPPGSAAHFGSAAGPAAELYQIPPGTVDWAATLTRGHQNAPAARSGRLFPVVLYSPGAGGRCRPGWPPRSTRTGSACSAYRRAVSLLPQAMYEDPRIKAGIDLDGATDTPLVTGSQHLAPVFDHGLEPFLLMGDPATTHQTVASWRDFWNRTPGWHLDLTLRGASGENSYKDAEPLIGELARQGGCRPRSSAPTSAR